MSRPSCGVVITSIALGACLSPHFEDHPRDVEQNFPAAGPGVCDGAPVFAPAALFGVGAPPPGSVVAVEGRPEALVGCFDVGCAWECCDNECWADTGCTYRIAVDALSAVCLGGAGFGCGGTDCSAFCEPLSSAPRSDYRFVGTVHYDNGRPRIAVGQICRIEL